MLEIALYIRLIYHYYFKETSNNGLFQKLRVVVASNASVEVQGVESVGRELVGWLVGWKAKVKHDGAWSPHG